MKILIIRFSSIGDIVLTTPIIRCLKQQVDNCEIHYATKSSYIGILKNNPHIDKIHELKQELRPLCMSLDKEKFDVVIDLHHNLRTLRLSWGMGVKRYSFPKLNWEKWLLTQFKIDKMPDLHIVDRYFETVAHLGVKNDGEGLDYFIAKSDVIEPASIDESLTKGYIAFVLGAKFATKQLPAEKIIEICDQLEKPVVLLGGKEDSKLGELVRRKSKHSELFDLCGGFNLNESASILQQADCVITHDTGLMHIASAYQKRIFSIWGNTVPAFGMYPYVSEELNTTFEVADLKCRPCSKIGYKKCPEGHFKCMLGINSKKVAEAVNQFSRRS